ncbi:MAG: hypothetical protein ACXV97_06090, partial [Chthoniobacterales bacterium]
MELNRFPVSRIACVVAIVATIGSVWLHITFGTHAGALWRDEVTSLEIATMRTFSEMWSNLAFESFPALFVLLLRTIAGVPANASDAELRVFGVLIGLLILGALWLNARSFRIGVPVLSLALIGFNPMIIRYGDSIRAYGLGILLILLSLGAIWWLLESFTLQRALLATVVAVCAVQTLYYNAVLLFAICMGASVITLRRKKIGQTMGVLAIGAVAGVSLLPYLSIIRRVQSWSFIWKVPFTASGTWSKLSETFGWPWLWLLLFAIAIILGAYALVKRADERLLFAFVTLIVALVGYGAFLRVLGYLLQPWYFIVLLAFAAMCFEILLANARPVRVGAALLVAILAAYPAWISLQARQTNIDLVAAKLETLASRGDLILINPFPFGISFQHYYRGAASIETIPPLSDLRSHRADLLKEKMMSTA